MALAGAGAILLVRTWARVTLAVVLVAVAVGLVATGLDPDPLGPRSSAGSWSGLGAARGHPAGAALAAAPIAGYDAARRRPHGGAARHVGRPGPRGGPHRLTGAGTISGVSAPAVATTRAAKDVTMSASHGNTPAAWTAVSIMFVGFLLAGLALPFELPWLFFVGLGVVVIGAVVGKVMSMMGMGSDQDQPDRRPHDGDPTDGGSTA